MNNDYSFGLMSVLFCLLVNSLGLQGYSMDLSHHKMYLGNLFMSFLEIMKMCDLKMIRVFKTCKLLDEQYLYSVEQWFSALLIPKTQH